MQDVHSRGITAFFCLHVSFINDSDRCNTAALLVMFSASMMLSERMRGIILQQL